MTRGRHLAPVPSRREQQVLDWIAEPEVSDASATLELAFAELPRVRQLRPWPWTRLAERLRPEPFGSPQARTVALVVATGLLLALLAGTWLVVGWQPQRDPLQGVVPPVPTLAPSSSAAAASAPAVSSAGPFPLASPGYLVAVANGQRDAFTIRTDDGTRRPIATDVTGRVVSPEWHPAGRSVLLQEQTLDIEQLWDVDVTGVRTSLVVIPCVRPCASRNEASWSHDGGRIVFFQALGQGPNGIPDTCGLAIYESAALAITSVASSPCAIIEERHPRFSPDDTRLAFWRSRSPGRVPVDDIEDSAIFVRDLASGEETQVTDWSLHATVLDWSPDGQWIAFVPDAWEDVDGADIWRIRPDGTNLERMTTLDDATHVLARPRYTPDGRWLLFMRVVPGDNATGELLAIPADGGDPVQVLPGTNVLDFDVRAGG